MQADQRLLADRAKGFTGRLDYDGSSGTIQHWYASAPQMSGSPDAVLSAVSLTANTRQTFIPDIQGTVMATLDSGIGTLAKAGTLPYGENSTVTASAFFYTGRWLDAEAAGSVAEASGIYYYRARMYSPTLGRFFQADPMGNVGGNNLYAYVGNDPLNQIDPYGQWGITASFGGLAEAGLSSIIAQAGYQGSVTVALLVDDNWDVSVVVNKTTGGAADIFSPNKDANILGASASAGISFGITNAQTASDLAGMSRTLSANVGVGPIQGSFQFSGSNNGTWSASISPPFLGIGYGLSASIYPTTTSPGQTLISTAPTSPATDADTTASQTTPSTPAAPSTPANSSDSGTGK